MKCTSKELGEKLATVGVVIQKLKIHKMTIEVHARWSLMG